MDKFQNDKVYLDLCKSLIEERMAWGTSADWSNQDFLALSRKIMEETGVQLSGTTLKRVWGKIKYQSIPNTNTLNTLVRFIGYENWLSFKAHYTDTKAGTAIHFDTKTNKRKKNGFLKISIISLIAILCISIISFIYRDQENSFSTADIKKVVFKSKPVAKGIPNTVVFNYDVQHLKASDFMIQQYWDTSKRFSIDPQHHEATSIYYYPGYWRAKLIVDGNVLRQHDLHIKSTGWMATLAASSNAPNPRYLLEDELVKDSMLRISDQTEKELLQTYLESPHILTYHNVRDFDQLNGDNMICETMIRNTYTKGNGVCQNSQILLLGSKGPIIIPLAIPGCTSEIGLMFNDVYQSGKNHDLSAFGVDFSKWQKLRLETKNRQAKIFLNDQLIHSLEYQQSIGQISGLRFRFLGNGEVQYIKLWDANNQLIYKDHFAATTAPLVSETNPQRTK